MTVTSTTTRSRLLAAAVLAAMALSAMALSLAAQNRNAGAARTGDWPYYGHDPGARRFSPLTQIPAERCHVTRAWTFDTEWADACHSGVTTRMT